MFRFIFANPWSTIKKMLICMLSIIGASCTVLEVLNAIFPSTDWDSFYGKWFGLFCFAVLIISFCSVALPLMKFTCKLKDYDIDITLKVGRIENEDSSIILSTNSCFLTTMDGEIIGSRGAQSSYQTKYYKDNLPELDSQLAEQLKDEHTCSDLIIKNKTYPIYNVGTIAKTVQGNRRVYFFAMNDINQYGQNINRDMDTIFRSLNGLWLNIIEKGHTEVELAIPVIASGRAGIAEATKETMIEAIVDTFISAVQNNSSIITKHLKIVIFPDDVKIINLSYMKEYIKYRCIFARKDIASRIESNTSSNS